MASMPIVHVEIAAKDVKVSSKFYADVFGWKIEVDEQFNYYGSLGVSVITPRCRG